MSYCMGREYEYYHEQEKKNCTECDDDGYKKEYNTCSYCYKGERCVDINCVGYIEVRVICNHGDELYYL